MSTRNVRLLIAYSIVALFAFGILSFYAKSMPYFFFDPPITRALQSFRTPWLDTLMDLAGQPGSPPQTLFLNPLIVLVVFVFGLRREALTLLLSIPLIGSLGTVIRTFIDRMRPDPSLMLFVLHPNIDPHYSFPSGHTVNFVAVLGFLMYVAYQKLSPSPRRSALLVVYGAFFVLIPLSRIYVADHWTSDVFGGLVLGSVFLTWMVLFYEWLNARASHKSKSQNGQSAGKRR